MDIKNLPLKEETLFCDAEDVKDHISCGSSSDIASEENLSDYSDYEEDNEFYQYTAQKHQAMQNNPQSTSNKISNYQPSDKLFPKYSNKINVANYEGPTIPNHAVNSLVESERRMENGRIRTKDKHDRATAEQVMDPRTRMILFKLLNRGVISEINGCISTGKEANVYHATSKTEKQFAIKIYKTSILIFKDRDKYVRGEFRFRHGYCRHNPRKMVKTWAEKEMRNLVRMYTNGLNVPSLSCYGLMYLLCHLLEKMDGLHQN